MIEMACDSEDDVLSLLVDQLDRLVERRLGRPMRERIEGGEALDDLWRPLAEAGFPTALLAEDEGGAGVAWTDGLRLIRRLAFHAMPLPLAETMVAHSIWSRCGDRAVDGAMSIVADPLRLSRSDDVFRLDGIAARIPWGSWAPQVLAFAFDDDGAGYLCRVPTEQVTCAPGLNMAYEPRDTLTWKSQPIAHADCVRAPAGMTTEILQLAGAQLRTQQLLGAMEQCIGQAIDYANERVQFGRPIARFQAVQHMLAVAAAQFAAATAAADLAIAQDPLRVESWLPIAIGKSRASEAATIIAAQVHQVFGAMGFAREHPLHYATRRLWSWRDEFGGDTYWNQRIGKAAAATGGDRLWDTLVNL